MSTRLTLSAVAAATALFFVAPEAHAQAKSNITDDPNSSSCTENCTDAGYTWAETNTPTEDSECAAANADFAAGCAHWLEEQREAAAPPPEEPSPEEAAAEADAAAANQAADSETPEAEEPPPGDETADPPANQ